MTRWLGAALALTLFTPSSASAGEFRQLTLADGRVLFGEVLTTQASGLEVRTPQGTQIVPFEVLADMLPIDESQYRDQPEWLVYLAVPDDKRELLSVAFSALEKVRVWGEPGAENAINEDDEMVILGCSRDFRCMAKLSTDLDSPWMWVVFADTADDGSLTLRAGINRGSQTETRATLTSFEGLALYEAVATTLALIPEKKAPKGFETLGETPARREPRPSRPAFTKERVVGLSFAPVPGLPSLLQGDGANFGIAMGVALPVTALWIGAVGKNAQSAGELAGVGLGGFYAITVATNQILGLNSLNKNAAVVMVEPAQHGQGATVGVTLPLK